MIIKSARDSDRQFFVTEIISVKSNEYFTIIKFQRKLLFRAQLQEKNQFLDEIKKFKNHFLRKTYTKKLDSFCKMSKMWFSYMFEAFSHTKRPFFSLSHFFSLGPQKQRWNEPLVFSSHNFSLTVAKANEEEKGKWPF